MNTSKEIELKEVLKELLGGDVVVTPQSMAAALAFTIKSIEGMLEQKEEREDSQPQVYATPTQLSRHFGVDRTTMWRQLRKFEEAGDIAPLKFESKDGKEGYPRYKIAELEGLLINRQVKGAVR